MTLSALFILHHQGGGPTFSAELGARASDALLTSLARVLPPLDLSCESETGCAGTYDRTEWTLALRLTGFSGDHLLANAVSAAERLTQAEQRRKASTGGSRGPSPSPWD